MVLLFFVFSQSKKNYKSWEEVINAPKRAKFQWEASE